MRPPSAALVALLLLLAAAPGSAAAQEAPKPGASEEEFYLLEEQVVTTASKRPQRQSEAPSTVTVLTADEIRNMGVVTFLDALKRVPGIQIGLSSFGQWMIVIRGIRTTGTEKVKLLIDGHSVNESFLGSGLTFFDDLPVENIKRIEVIRGPGSALYGANAFAGVVNVITKRGRDLNGGEVSIGGGTFGTLAGDGQFGQDWRDEKERGERRAQGGPGEAAGGGGKPLVPGLEFSVYGHHLRTDGFDARIVADRQTSDDAKTGTVASLAPARAAFSREKYLVEGKVAYGGFEFQSLFSWRERDGYLGLRQTLDDGKSDFVEYQLFNEARYQAKLFDGKVASGSKLYFDLFDESIFFQNSPPGHRDSASRPPFPQGQITDLDLSNATIGFEEQVDVQLHETNALTAGFVYESIHQFNVKNKTNQDRITGAVLPELVDFTHTANTNKRTIRDVVAVYAQDVWNPLDWLGITVGARFDRYSSVGGTVNPRVGLVFQPWKDLTLKALYGRAFRAPSFRELYDRNSRSTIGNPDLDPEIINTYEAEIGYRFTDWLEARANYAYIRIDDIIVEDSTKLPRPFINQDEAQIHAFEVEVRAAWKNGTYAYANYSYVDAHDQDYHPLPDVADHLGNVGVNWRIHERVNLNVNLLWVGKRDRARSDPRNDLKHYEVVDASLRLKLHEQCELEASVWNAFDDDAREPAPFVVPGDFPLTGLAFFFRIRARF